LKRRCVRTRAPSVSASRCHLPTSGEELGAAHHPKAIAQCRCASADMLENPSHADAARGRLAGDDELLGRVRAAFAVDPQAFLDIERTFGCAELPERAAPHA